MYVDTYVASFHVFGLTFWQLYGTGSPVCFQHTLAEYVGAVLLLKIVVN